MPARRQEHSRRAQEQARAKAPVLRRQPVLRQPALRQPVLAADLLEEEEEEARCPRRKLGMTVPLQSPAMQRVLGAVDLQAPTLGQMLEEERPFQTVEEQQSPEMAPAGLGSLETTLRTTAAA